MIVMKIECTILCKEKPFSKIGPKKRKSLKRMLDRKTLKNTFIREKF